MPTVAGFRSLLARWLGGASASGTPSQGSSQVCIRSVSVYPAVALYDTVRQTDEGWADGFTLEEWAEGFTIDEWASSFGLSGDVMRGVRMRVYAAVDADPTVYAAVAGTDLRNYAAVDADPSVYPAVAGTVTVGCQC